MKKHVYVALNECRFNDNFQPKNGKCKRACIILFVQIYRHKARQKIGKL